MGALGTYINVKHKVANILIQGRSDYRMCKILILCSNTFLFLEW